MGNPNTHLNPPYLDDEEKKIIEAFESGEYGSDEVLSQEAREEIEEAAKNTLKRRPISIRIQERDLRMLKLQAQKDGIPYQTLIQSVLHRYAEGSLKRIDWTEEEISEIFE